MAPRGKVPKSNVEIYAKRLIKTREKLNLILSERTEPTLETIAKDTDRDNFMDPDRAKAYGLIDEIIIVEIGGLEMARNEDSIENARCSFCGKSQSQVKRMVAGPGVYICNECIELCEEIMDVESMPEDVRLMMSPNQKKSNSN